METEHEAVLARFKAAWVQIADYFKNYPEQLMFESINEPRFSEDWGKDTPRYFEMLDELNHSCYGIVRGSGGLNAKRPLVLPTLTCSPEQPRLNHLYNTIVSLQDENLIATIHYYGYYPFSVNRSGATTFNAVAQTHIEQTFDRAYDTFVSKGIPVIVGEYGLLGFDKSLGTIQHGEILRYFEYVTYYAQKKKLTLMLWDNGQHYNRRTLSWGDESLYQVMSAGLNGRSSNSITDSIYIRKNTALTDAKIALCLNGNALTVVKHGNRTFERGKDHDCNGEELVIYTHLLAELLSKELGTNAKLSCSFSAGADWMINVIYYDIPELGQLDADREDQSASWPIPIAINGDSLATMEAVYENGVHAGIDVSTSFLEFNEAFYPSDSGNSVILTPSFLNQLKDGKIKLRFHFWSGSMVDYTLIKEGEHLNGVPAGTA